MKWTHTLRRETATTVPFWAVSWPECRQWFNHDGFWGRTEFEAIKWALDELKSLMDKC